MTDAKRVLVTGAGGFIGRHTLSELLRRGYEVHAAVRRPLPDAPAKAEHHTVDLLQEGAPEKLVSAIRPTHLLHLAWTVTPGQFWWAPENLDWVAASLKLYRAFTAAGGRRALFAGTCAEYDWRNDLLAESDTPLNPGTLYGVAKTSLYRLIEAVTGLDGTSVAWGRIFYLYGPHEPAARLVPDVMISLLQGRPALCGDGKAERDYMHVADVARALVLTLDGEYRGPVNIASGICRPLRDVITAIADLIGRPELIRLGARPTPRDEPHRLAAATWILNEEIGFTPRYDLADGLRTTLDWWRTTLSAV